MDMVLLLVISGLVAMHSAKNAAVDWRMARSGQLPPRYQVAIEQLRTAGKVAEHQQVPPEHAARLIRRGGAGRAYLGAVVSDTFDALRERHTVKDEKRRVKRQAKRDGTYEPGGFERWLATWRASWRRRWDGAWNNWADKREEGRRERRGDDGDQPSTDPNDDPAGGREPVDSAPTGEPRPEPDNESDTTAEPTPDSEPVDADVVDGSDDDRTPRSIDAAPADGPDGRSDQPDPAAVDGAPHVPTDSASGPAPNHDGPSSDEPVADTTAAGSDHEGIPIAMTGTTVMNGNGQSRQVANGTGGEVVSQQTLARFESACAEQFAAAVSLLEQAMAVARNNGMENTGPLTAAMEHARAAADALGQHSQVVSQKGQMVAEAFTAGAGDVGDNRDWHTRD